MDSEYPNDLDLRKPQTRMTTGGLMGLRDYYEKKKNHTKPKKIPKIPQFSLKNPLFLLHYFLVSTRQVGT
jgi:hypothetical protein